MIPGIIVSHGKLAEELKVAVELIVGPSRKLHAISNEGFEPDSLAESIRKHFPENQPVFIFTDLRGGSCWRAAMIAAKAHDNIRVFAGVNMPMLISFITKRSQLPVAELLEVILEDTSRGIMLEKLPERKPGK
ncbi:MAG: hypothetical protein AAFP70_13640 [Calditrichota bacterium]